jgi:4-cresol dehydrogenase (hydroxylating)
MADFLDAIREIVGDANVLESGDPVLLELHADPFAFDDAHSGPPVGVIFPGSVEEVSAVVLAATESGQSLWTVSRGRNLGYGGAIPASATSFVLDLSRMDRILDVNVESGYVVVEPGVSFFDLHDFLTENRIPLRMSVPDLGGGSLIGNALERGFGYAAHGEHGSYLAGLEVVLPSGEIIRTGMGAIEGSAATHVYRGGFGPSVEGLFSQSSLGIVVNAGIWLAPEPETIAACVVRVQNHTDLAILVDTLRPLLLDSTIDGVVAVRNSLSVASQSVSRAAAHDGDGPVPDEAITALAEQLGVGGWNASFGVYGAARVVEAKVEVVRERVESIPGATFEVRTYAGDVSDEDVHPADRGLLGIPSSDLMQMATWRGGTPGHTDFSLVTRTVGRSAQQLVDLVRFVVEKDGFDHLAGFMMFGRYSILRTSISFDSSSSDDRDAVRALLSELITVGATAGYAPYRAHSALMDEVADVYAFNDSSLRRFVTQLKDAVDPSGVLSPGKQGIWPTKHDG